MKNYRSTNQRNKNLNADFIALCSIILPTIFAGIGLATINLTHAEGETSVNKTAVVHVESSCSMSHVDTVHADEINSGQYKDDIGTSSFYATCNDLNGYSIYAIGYSGETEGNTAMLASAPLTTSSDIQTGTSGTDSYWAVKLTAGSNVSIENSFNNFHAIPSNYTKVAKRASGTSSNALAFTSTYKISLANNQPAGTYNGAVKYILINPTMSQEDLPEGYEINSQGELVKAVFSGITTMQQMTPEICAAESTPSATDTEVPTKQLIDTRDNKLYWVAKLADGHCWMTQNLDLNITAAGLSSTDTDITADWNSSSERPPVATLTDASQYSNSNNTTSTASWDAGDWYYDGTSSTSCGSKKTTYEGCTGFSNTGNAHYHVGNMYSWGAATAGTGGAITSGQASGSICPKGWHLPMSSSDPSFANLQSKGSLGSTVQNWLDAPYYFTRTGRLWYDSDKLYSAGTRGYYWSSTPNSNSSRAYYLDFYSSSYVYPADNYARALGMAVRCVAW